MSRTILLVDDDSTLSTMLVATLNRRGYTVYYADTLAEGRQLLEAQAAVLTLAALDVRLPDGEGWEIVAEMRAATDPVRADLPIMMMSSYPVDRARMQRYRVANYVQKPFSVAAFIKAVEETAAQNQASAG